MCKRIPLKTAIDLGVFSGPNYLQFYNPDSWYYNPGVTLAIKTGENGNGYYIQDPLDPKTLIPISMEKYRQLTGNGKPPKRPNRRTK